MAFAMSYELLSTFAPIVVYWIYSGMYAMMGSMDNYRLYTREEEDKKNLVTRGQALRGVLLNQACQVAFLTILFMVTGKGGGNAVVVRQPSLFGQAIRFVIAMLILDVWQYFGHRFFHMNKFMYRHIHSKHHLVIVPYAFGAQYQHPLEALILDTGGTAMAYFISGMAHQAGMFFFTLTLIKSVDDHCGLWLPGHPFHKIFSNNSAFHAVHHQLYGGKANFSAPFFTYWDKICGTYLPYSLEKKKDGGFELLPKKKDQ